MFDRVLLPTDGSDAASSAVEYGGLLAATFGAAGIVVHVSESERGDDRGAEVVRGGRQLVSQMGAVDHGDYRSGDPVRAILESATENGADAIVMGVHGHLDETQAVTASRTRIDTETRATLGRVTQHVVREAPVPVLVVPPCHPKRQRVWGSRFVVATDGSIHARRTLDTTVELARLVDGDVHAVSVVDCGLLDGDEDVEVMWGPLYSNAHRIAADSRDVATDGGIAAATTAVRIGSTHQEIRAYADECGADCLALGVYGRSGPTSGFLGTVTERILRTATRPVWTFR